MLKIRYSYGEVGDDNVTNQRWLYATQWAYGIPPNAPIYQGLYEDPVLIPGTENLLWVIRDVHWEKSVKHNLGIDYSFLEVYWLVAWSFSRDTRSDILYRGAVALCLPISSYSVTANLGKVRTKGYELELRINKTLTNQMHLWGNFNMTHAENKILVHDDPELEPAYREDSGICYGTKSYLFGDRFANTRDEIYGMTPENTNDNQKLPGAVYSHRL